MNSTALQEIIKKIKNLDYSKVISNIIVNSPQIIKDMLDIISQLQKQNYLQAGYDLGDILYRIVLISLNNKKVGNFTPEDVIFLIKGLF